MNETVKKQILEVRDTGLTNMLDINAVQIIAYRMGLYGLVNLIEEEPENYAKFIFWGDETDEEEATA